MVVELFLFVFDELPIKLVRKQIDRGVHVTVLGVGNNFAASYMQRRFGLLPQLLDLKNDLNGNDAIEMPF